MTQTIQPFEDKLIKALTQLFGLPQRMRSFQINGAFNERTTIRVTYFPTEESREPTTQRFCLMPIDDSQPSQPKREGTGEDPLAWHPINLSETDSLNLAAGFSKRAAIA